VWAKRPGPAFAGIHGTDFNGFQRFFDQWASKGFSPTILAATGPADNPVYAAVMEQSAHGVSLTRHSLRSGHPDDPGTIQYWLREAQRQNWIPRWLSVFGEPGNRRYAVVLDPNPGWVLWNVDGLEGEDGGAHQARFEAQFSQWAWPSFVTVTPDGRFVSMFRDGDTGPWVARHNPTSADYQREVDHWWVQGYFPLYIQGGGNGSVRRFACLFTQGETPARRVFVTTGRPLPAFQAVDHKVETVMRDSGTRAVGVAITRQERLVYARGYTWGEPSYPVTQPETMFRIASCTKPITSMAIHFLIQQGQLRLTDRMQNILSLQPPPGRSIAAGMGNITVHHLLTHAAGWDRTQVYDLAPLEDVARAFGQNSLSITREQMARYKLSEPLQFTPGSRMAYCNLGYLLLGMIVDRLSQFDYNGFVRRRIMAPLSLSRPHLARAAVTEQLPGTARQYDNDSNGPDLRIVWSATTGPIDGPRPLVPLAYGGEDLRLFDAFGGWCMAPCDYAKILASLDRGDASPVLNQASLDLMWTPQPFVPGQTYVNGWDRFDAGGGIFGVQHGGGMPGVSSRILWRSDGWGFAVFGNGPVLPDIYPELAAMRAADWPSHDLFPQVGIPSF
jgi:CubicO group peptidase (beta-lactamase class C family)